MKRATVYRIETKNGTGMCGSGGIYNAAGSDAYSPTRHPGPHEDDKLHEATRDRMNGRMYFDYQPYHFGFASIDQLRNWVYKDEWLVSLHNDGHVLAVIESEDVIAGYTQAVFIRPEEYQKVSILEYFNLTRQGDTDKEI